MQNKVNSKTMFFSTELFKNINITFLLAIFLGTQLFVLYSMEQQWIEVYSHGFGETGGANGPTYPDAPGRMDKAVFYTRPSVICLTNYLHHKVNKKGYNKIYLLASSCGAGIAINCLYKLIHYNDDYFQGTSIQSKQDAQKIIDAINNGAIDITVPFLSIKKAKIVDTSTTIGGYGLASAGVGALLYITGTATLPVIGLPLVLYGSYQLINTVGDLSKSTSTSCIDDYIVPAISNQHYDSEHIKPIDAVAFLKNIIKCPVLLHFCKKDGVLANPDEDTITVYESFRMGNEHNTSHNNSPDNCQYKQLQKQFKDMVRGRGPHISECQPTVQTLRDMIFPSLWNLKLRKK
jgi:hypothetical protein